MFKAEWHDRSDLHFEKLYLVIVLASHSWGPEVGLLVTGWGGGLQGPGDFLCFLRGSAGQQALPCLGGGGGGRELSPSQHKEVFPADCDLAELEPPLP